MTDIPQIDEATVKAVMSIVEEVIGSAVVRFSEKLQELENRINSIDEQIATLIIGYGEQAVFMEALVAQMAFATDQERTSFNNSLTEARKKMLEVMRDASAANLADEDPNLASAVEDLVNQKLLDSND
jgi:uncharacterized membrane protein